ncbi:Tetraacyldisaccharide 4'-kinase [termite gut metagenome]|uniref:tetraacyldisaccharide 4'-kinase n=1 Tax=termite gut metagenome TaxID=433724 RepID=A0A5J4RM09_9ZZZZ
MIEEHPVKIKQWLYPASFLYGIGVNLRNKLFDWKILRSTIYSIPVICVGNIVAGGTGKTPHTEYLIKLLRDEFHIAVLSRGYKRKTKGYVLANSQSNARSIGDESYQIKKKFPEICVAVDGNRRRGIEKLYLLRNPRIDVVILDDAFQHRYVQAGINILLTDYHCLYSDDVLLPAGRLREPISGKNRASAVIVTKCPQYITPIDYNIIIKKLALYSYQELYFSTFEYGNLTPVFPDIQTAGKRKLEDLAENEDVLLITGIASPARVIEELKKYTSHIVILSFADHHDFNIKDIALIEQRFNNLKSEKKIIITTEKDAARLVSYPKITDEIKKWMYALPIEVKFLKEQQNTFNKYIIDYVRKNKRNSIFSERENRVET